MSESQPHSDAVNRLLRPVLLWAAASCLLLILVGAIAWGRVPGQIFRAWLFAWMFWLGISLGSMGVVMMHHLLGGGWGYMIRRFGETAALCTPLLAVLFLPVIAGAKWIYPWMDKAVVNADAVIRYKHEHFLNWPFWTIRAAVILVVFSVMALLIQTRPLDRMGANPAPLLARIRRVSAGGLVVYFFLMTLGSIDWVMSREPHWRSSVFGFIVCISQAVSATCFLILVLYAFRHAEPVRRILHADFLNDLGNVLLTFVILWAYLSFAQFLIIWIGNAQGEIDWYVRRTAGGWWWVGAALILFHFLIPFLLLLQRPMKRRLGALALTAAGLFVIHIVDELYWVTPADTEAGTMQGLPWLYAQLLNVLSFLTVGGVWLAGFLWLLRTRPPISAGDDLPVPPIDHGHGRHTISPPVE